MPRPVDATGQVDFSDLPPNLTKRIPCRSLPLRSCIIGEMVFGENSTMIYRGTVENGVVVLENGTLLPEGTRVRVEPLGKDENVGRAGEDDPVFRMSDLAVDTGLPDLASNVDHYLYGHPKANDGK